MDDMHDNAIKKVKERVFERQFTFYAFLNKEFNVMNYKSARCSMHCFDTTEKPLKEVNHCLQICRQGIQECRQFAFTQ